MGRVALKTLRSYLTTIYSIYVDRILLVTVFENTSLHYILDGATSLNPNLKEATLKLLISHSILTKIVISSNLIPGVNTNATFCLAFTGYLYIREISYINKQ
jgi:hypothetical protein